MIMLRNKLFLRLIIKEVNMKKRDAIALFLMGSACLLSTSSGYAQEKIYKARLAPVAESGYYNIELDHRLVGNAKTTAQRTAKSAMSNLRIVQQGPGDRIEVPYFIRAVQPTAKETKVVDHPLLDIVEKDSINRFVIHNPEERQLTDFYITINKADVALSASVKGSNNKQEWFIVKQKTPIYTYSSSEREEETVFVSIPEGRYVYYEMELINNQTTPVKVNKVSTVVGTKTYGQFSPTQLRYDKSTLNAKDKKTRVSFVAQDLNYTLNKIVFEIATPRDYYRKAVLRDSITKVAVPFMLSSKQRNEWILDDVLVRNPYIEIDNGSNIPLSITSVQTYSLTRFATAYLDAHTNYTVEVNTSTKDVPQYDIEYFKNEIPAVLPTLKTLDFEVQVLQDDPKEQKAIEDKAKQMNRMLWAVLVVVGLLVSFICYRAFKKLEK